MRLKQGNTRYVIILKKIVIKLPRIKLLSFIKSCVHNAKHGNLIKSFKFSSSALLSPRALLFKGIIDNFNEYRLYKKLHHKLLMPTYFSLFGLLNLQKRGEVVSEDVHSFKKLYEATNGEIFKDSHAFDNPENFCLDQGIFKMVDYGSERVAEVLSNYADSIFKSFNIDSK